MWYNYPLIYLSLSIYCIILYLVYIDVVTMAGNREHVPRIAPKYWMTWLTRVSCGIWLWSADIGSEQCEHDNKTSVTQTLHQAMCSHWNKILSYKKKHEITCSKMSPTLDHTRSIWHQTLSPELFPCNTPTLLPRDVELWPPNPGVEIPTFRSWPSNSTGCPSVVRH